MFVCLRSERVSENITTHTSNNVCILIQNFMFLVFQPEEDKEHCEIPCYKYRPKFFYNNSITISFQNVIHFDVVRSQIECNVKVKIEI